MGVCDPPLACTCSITLAVRAGCAREAGTGALASASSCAATAFSSWPSLARIAVILIFHMASSSDLTIAPSCAFLSTPSHLPSRSTHASAPGAISARAASASAFSSASACASSASVGGANAPGPGSPTVAPAASAPDSCCSVSISRRGSSSSETEGERGSSGTTPAKDSSSGSSESKEAIEPWKGGAFCAIAAR